VCFVIDVLSIRVNLVIRLYCTCSTDLYDTLSNDILVTILCRAMAIVRNWNVCYVNID